MCPVGREKRRTLVLTVVSPGEVVRAGDESVEGRALLFSSLTRPQRHAVHDTSDLRACHGTLWCSTWLFGIRSSSKRTNGAESMATTANGQMVYRRERLFCSRMSKPVSLDDPRFRPQRISASPHGDALVVGGCTHIHAHSVRSPAFETACTQERTRTCMHACVPTCTHRCT